MAAISGVSLTGTGSDVFHVEVEWVGGVASLLRVGKYKRLYWLKHNHRICI